MTVSVSVCESGSVCHVCVCVGCVCAVYVPSRRLAASGPGVVLHSLQKVGAPGAWRGGDPIPWAVRRRGSPPAWGAHPLPCRWPCLWGPVLWGAAVCSSSLAHSHPAQRDTRAGPWQQRQACARARSAGRGSASCWRSELITALWPLPVSAGGGAEWEAVVEVGWWRPAVWQAVAGRWVRCGSGAGAGARAHHLPSRGLAFLGAEHGSRGRRRGQRCPHV